MKRILAISLGGTLFMSSDDGKKSATSLGQNYDVFSDFPQVRKVCKPDFMELMAVDSSNLRPDFWTELAQTIVERRKVYDGFVVLQGTDTLSFTAAALSFALQGLGKPVILTGA